MTKSAPNTAVNKFQCPSCGGTESTVKDSRPRESGFIWRRRMCDTCHSRFSTVEVPLAVYETLGPGIDSLRAKMVADLNAVVHSTNALSRALKSANKLRGSSL